MAYRGRLRSSARADAGLAGESREDNEGHQRLHLRRGDSLPLGMAHLARLRRNVHGGQAPQRAKPPHPRQEGGRRARLGRACAQHFRRRNLRRQHRTALVHPRRARKMVGSSDANECLYDRGKAVWRAGRAGLCSCRETCRGKRRAGVRRGHRASRRCVDRGHASQDDERRLEDGAAFRAQGGGMGLQQDHRATPRPVDRHARHADDWHAQGLSCRQGRTRSGAYNSASVG